MSLRSAGLCDVVELLVFLLTFGGFGVFSEIENVDESSCR